MIKVPSREGANRLRNACHKALQFHESRWVVSSKVDAKASFTNSNAEDAHKIKEACVILHFDKQATKLRPP